MALRNARTAAKHGLLAVIVEDQTYDEEEVHDGLIGDTDTQSELRLFGTDDELREHVEEKGLRFEDRDDIAHNPDGATRVSFENSLVCETSAYVYRPEARGLAGVY